MGRRDGKPRKWSNLKGQIPDAAEQVELTPRTLEVIKQADERRTKVVEDPHTGATKEEPVTMEDLAAEWDGLDEEVEFQELRDTERNITYDALTRRVLEELERVKAISGHDLWRGNGQTFSPKFALNIKVTDPVALMKWVKDTGQEHLLTIPRGRLNGIVAECMDADKAAALTPGERAEIKPGEPGSLQPPPGVEVSLFTTVHHTNPGRKARKSSDADDEGPF